jgi:transmembrane sensor
MSWLKGELRFRNTPLDEAVEEFNRYNAEQLLIVDPTIVKRHIAGVFVARDPESFADSIERSFGIHHEVVETRDGGRVIRLRNGNR